MKAKSDLLEKCEYIAEQLSDREFWAKEYQKDHGDDIEDELHAGALEWLEDQLDWNYEVSRDGNYVAGRVLCAFGGPNIWADFRNNVVQGYWGGESVEVPFVDDMDVDSHLQEYYEMSHE